MQFNTVIAALMEYVNALGTRRRRTREDLLTLIKLVGPFAPHLGDEAWERLGGAGLPARGRLADLRRRAHHRRARHRRRPGRRQAARRASSSPATPAEDEARAAALAIPNVAKHLEGRVLKKFIYKAGRIIGLVTGPA